MFLYPAQFSKLFSATTELATAQTRFVTAVTADMVAESTRLTRTTVLGSTKTFKTAKGNDFEFREPGLKDMSGSAADVWIKNSQTIAEETLKFWSSALSESNRSETKKGKKKRSKAKTATGSAEFSPTDLAMNFSDWSRIWTKPSGKANGGFTPFAWPENGSSILSPWFDQSTSGQGSAQGLFPQFPLFPKPAAPFPFAPGRIPSYDDVLKYWQMGHEILSWSNRAAEWQRIIDSSPFASLNPWLQGLNAYPNSKTPSMASVFEPFMKPFATGINGNPSLQELTVTAPFMVWQWAGLRSRA